MLLSGRKLAGLRKAQSSIPCTAEKKNKQTHSRNNQINQTKPYKQEENWEEEPHFCKSLNADSESYLASFNLRNMSNFKITGLKHCFSAITM